MLSRMHTAAECLVKAAEMERFSDHCPIAAKAIDYEELAEYWRGLARLTANKDERSRSEALLDQWLRKPSTISPQSLRGRLVR